VTDPWTVPDSPYGGASGWGPPPPPEPPRRWWLPLVLVTAFAVLAAFVAVSARPSRTRQTVRPTPSLSPSPTPAPRATRTPSPAPPPRSPSPVPQVVRTYSAPPDGVPVRGRVVDANGRPVAGAAVSMQLDEGFFGSLARGLTALFSLGLACFTDICTVPYGEGRTAADGTYTLYLEREAGDYHLAVERKGGARVHATVAFRGTGLKLPDVVYWNPSPSLSVSGTTARVRFRSPPSRLGSWNGASATVEDAEQRAYVRLPDASPGDAFDARLIEDVSARLQVSVNVRTRLGDTSYSSSVPVRGRLRPLTRGKPCYEYGRSGRPVRNAPCPLTDGSLLASWTPKVADYQCSKDATSCDRRVMVDLGSARRIRYVAVRECDDFFDQVEVSADGSSWQVVIAEHSGEGGDVDGVCARDIDLVARYVRVKGPQGGFYTRRSEISLF
jgi:hypothetical protein